MSTIQLPKRRIIEIDQLKGLSIILVVMWHLCGISLDNRNEMQQMLATLRMPLFFFLSGFVLKTTPVLLSDFFIFIRNKFCRLMLPFFIMGFLYSYLVGEIDFLKFIMHPYKNGYWYLYVLFTHTIIVFFFNQLSNKFCKNRIKLDILLIAAIYSLLLLCCSTTKWITTSGEARQVLLNITNIRFIATYSLPLFFGLIVRKYNLTDIFFKKQLSFTISLLALILLYYFNGSSRYYSLSSITMGISAIICVVYIFFTALPKHSYIMNMLAFVGTKTLDIYVLHYFILSTIRLSAIKPFLVENPFIELILLLVLSIAVITTCIFTGYIIRQSRLLGFLLLGSKYTPSNK